MRARLLVVFAVVFLFGFFVAAYFTSQKRPPESPPAPPAPPKLAIPTFPKLPIKQLDYQVVPDGEFPQKLPAYSYSVDNPRNASSVIAQRLGFDGDPKELKDISGPRYYWTKNNTTLSVGGNPLATTYISDASKTKTIEPSFENEAKEAATSFVNSALGLEAQGISIKAIKTFFLKPTDNQPNYLDGPTGATAIEFVFQYELPDGPIFPPSAGMPGARITLNADKETTKATIWVPPKIKKEESIYSLITYGAAVARLRSGLGALVSYGTTDKNQIGYSVVSIRVSAIESVDLGYYFSDNNTAFLPVFRFVGIAKDTKTGKDIKTTTLVSALP